MESVIEHSSQKLTNYVYKNTFEFNVNVSIILALKNCLHTGGNINNTASFMFNTFI